MINKKGNKGEFPGDLVVGFGVFTSVAWVQSLVGGLPQASWYGQKEKRVGEEGRKDGKKEE